MSWVTAILAALLVLVTCFTLFLLICLGNAFKR